MSSQKTEHYQLHAWEPSDPFLRGEFNANFSAIDQAIHDGLTAVESVAEGRARIVAGTYTGNGAASQTIALGATPAAVLVERKDGVRPPNSTGRVTGGLAVPGEFVGKGDAAVEIIAGGFQVRCIGDYHLCNENNITYHYIAFL